MIYITKIDIKNKINKLNTIKKEKKYYLGENATQFDEIENKLNDIDKHEKKEFDEIISEESENNYQSEESSNCGSFIVSDNEVISILSDNEYIPPKPRMFCGINIDKHLSNERPNFNYSSNLHVKYANTSESQFEDHERNLECISKLDCYESADLYNKLIEYFAFVTEDHEIFICKNNRELSPVYLGSHVSIYADILGASQNQLKKLRKYKTNEQNQYLLLIFKNYRSISIFKLSQVLLEKEYRSFINVENVSLLSSIVNKSKIISPIKVEPIEFKENKCNRCNGSGFYKPVGTVQLLEQACSFCQGNGYSS